MRRLLVLLVVAAALVAAGTAQACGVERWPVKTLTDPAASEVTRSKGQTAEQLRQLPVLERIRGSLPRSGIVERTIYRVRVRLVEMKLEADGDIHLVIADPKAPRRTMIAEFPSEECVATASTLRMRQMIRARARLVAAFGAATESRWLPIGKLATLVGVGFFDVIHGQRGVAPNGIELHPVLSVTGIAGS
jgi:hypothetical protein